MAKGSCFEYAAEYERYSRSDILELISYDLLATVTLRLLSYNLPSVILQVRVNKQNRREYSFKGLVVDNVSEAQPMNRYGKKSIYRKLYKRHKKLLQTEFDNILPHVKDGEVCAAMHSILSNHSDFINELNPTISGRID